VSPSDPGRPKGGRQRGQSLVEFALVLPVFMLILVGMIEFGLLLTHDLTIEYATREGARAGAALSNGADTNGCSGTNWTTVDPLVIAAVERVLQSPGSQIVISKVSQIVIYRANATTGDNDQGAANVWTYSQGNGPIPQGSTDHLNFVDTAYPGTDAWQACTRVNALPAPDSIGVTITYTYTFRTPLASLMGLFGGSGSSLIVTDRTVMQLNPGTF
jgi:Flp pilus assembly protein TadG